MSLTALAETILANSRELDKRGVVDINSEVGFTNLTRNDYQSRASLLTALQELERLALGPMESLYVLSIAGSIQMVGLHAIARYNIPQHVPDAGISSSSLAAKVKADEQTLTRLIRHGIIYGIFQEPEPGFFAHTPISKALRDNKDLLDMARWATEDNWPTALRALDALEQWPGSRESTHTAFNLAMNTTDPLFKFLEEHPERLKRLSGVFRIYPHMPLHGPDTLSGRPLWQEIDKPGATVVDVGGNRGHISLQLARVTKNVQFIVEDLPGTVDMSKDYLPAEYKSRISYKVHDFFQEQPLKGADVYFFRKILHDWPDHACIKILRNILPALKTGARIVLCERILANQAQTGYEEKEARCGDIVMLMTLHGRERTESDWRRLFSEVDPRLELDFERWQCNTHGLIKATWNG